MQFITVATLLFTSLATAVPAELHDSYWPYNVCSSGTPECCSTDVLGLVDLDCRSPPTVPFSASQFTTICAALGQRPRCCALPILGQALICQTPIGTA